MSASDSDLELLESYLDDELDSRELESLRQRLYSEPALSAAMDELRDEREMRQSFFSACEPDDVQVDQLMRSVRQMTTRQIVWSGRSRSFGWVGAAAACLVVGFFAGRGAHLSPQDSNSVAQNSVQTGALKSETALVSNQPEIARNPIPFDGPLVNRDRQRLDNFNLRGMTVADVATLNPFPGGHINVVDSNGRIMRSFDSHEQYLRFVSDQTGQASPSTAPAGMR